MRAKSRVFGDLEGTACTAGIQIPIIRKLMNKSFRQVGFETPVSSLMLFFCSIASAKTMGFDVILCAVRKLKEREV